MKIKFAQLHTPLFFAGINFGEKLDVTKRVGLVMLYDRLNRELNVQYIGRSTIIPADSNVVHMEPGDIEVKKAAPITNNGKPVKAQVQVPAGMRNDD